MGTIYVGMDIHKNFIQAAAVNEQGTFVKEEKINTDRAAIGVFLHQFGGYAVKAAIESTCVWLHIFESLESLGIETTLVNTRRTKVIAEAKIKTDTLDARSIAQCLRTGFIAASWIPPKRVREQRDLVRHQLTLRKEITAAKNRVHSLLLKRGIKHTYSDLFGRAGRAFLKSLSLEGTDQYRMESYLRIVEQLLSERRQTTTRIEAVCKTDTTAMLLTTVPGISYYSALTILSEVGDFARFPNPKKLCNYAGLVPRTIQSGGKVFHGRILKECNHNLKWILTQCVKVHIRCCLVSDITRLYWRVRDKKGAGKATIAAERKLLTALWHMTRKNQAFKPAG